MEEKILGKISGIEFGIGGYQDAQLGLRVSLSMTGSGIADWRGTWCPGIVDSGKNSRWSERDREQEMVNIMRFIADLLIKAKKTGLNDLIGVPVEVTLEGMALKSWRILEEVL